MRVAVLMGVQEILLSPSQFGPDDADLIRGVEGKAHLVADDAHHGDGDAVADDDLLAGLPAQNQHGSASAARVNSSLRLLQRAAATSPRQLTARGTPRRTQSKNHRQRRATQSKRLPP